MKYVVLLLLLFVLAGCYHLDDEDYFCSVYLEEQVDEAKKFLQGRGLVGLHPLERFKTVLGVQGVLGGSKGIFGGCITGSVTTGPIVLFTWRPQLFGSSVMGSEVVFCSLPIQCVTIIIDNGREVPFVRFKFNLDCIIPKLNYETVPSDFPSASLLQPPFVLSCKIFMSEKDLQSAVYLVLF